MTADVIRDALTRSSEDYLKAIYRLSQGGVAAGTTDLAQALDLAPASVSGMIKRLSEQGLLEHEPYRGVRLTALGRRIALRMLRRHRVIETYLVAQLGYTWDTVHDEAERLEHAVSDALVERMAEALGNPLVDPHGDPIPGANGEMLELVHVPLCEVAVGETVTIRRVDSADPARLRYIAEAGLVPGATLTVDDRQPFRGPITVRTEAGDRVVGHDLAALLLCSKGNTR